MPTAAVHLRQDTGSLKAYITELETLVRGLPVAEKWAFDLDIAVKGIVKERPLSKEKEKRRPTLVVEDDLVLW